MIKHIYTIEKVGIYWEYAISKGSDRGVLTARVPAQAYQLENSRPSKYLVRDRCLDPHPKYLITRYLKDFGSLWDII